MYIGSVQVGHRIGLGVIDEEQSRFSMGVSMAGDTTTDDYTLPYTDIMLTFPLMDDNTKNALKAYLNVTVKQGGIVNVTPDGSDDLQVQRVTPSPFIYQKMKAAYVASNMWRTEVYLRYIGSALGAQFGISDDQIVKL